MSLSQIIPNHNADQFATYSQSSTILPRTPVAHWNRNATPFSVQNYCPPTNYVIAQEQPPCSSYYSQQATVPAAVTPSTVDDTKLDRIESALAEMQRTQLEIAGILKKPEKTLRDAAEQTSPEGKRRPLTQVCEQAVNTSPSLLTAFNTTFISLTAVRGDLHVLKKASWPAGSEAASNVPQDIRRTTVSAPEPAHLPATPGNGVASSDGESDNILSYDGPVSGIMDSPVADSQYPSSSVVSATAQTRVHQTSEAVSAKEKENKLPESQSFCKSTLPSVSLSKALDFLDTGFALEQTNDNGSMPRSGGQDVNGSSLPSAASAGFSFPRASTARPSSQQALVGTHRNQQSSVGTPVRQQLRPLRASQPFETPPATVQRRPALVSSEDSASQARRRRHCPPFSSSRPVSTEKRQTTHVQKETPHRVPRHGSSSSSSSSSSAAAAAAVGQSEPAKAWSQIDDIALSQADVSNMTDRELRKHLLKCRSMYTAAE
eukprot:ANDGO_02556.mRNA.1 hypothetical protein